MIDFRDLHIVVLNVVPNILLSPNRERLRMRTVSEYVATTISQIFTTSHFAFGGHNTYYRVATSSLFKSVKWLLFEFVTTSARCFVIFINQKPPWFRERVIVIAEPPDRSGRIGVKTYSVYLLGSFFTNQRKAILRPYLPRGEFWPDNLQIPPVWFDSQTELSRGIRYQCCKTRRECWEISTGRGVGVRLSLCLRRMTNKPCRDHQLS